MLAYLWSIPLLIGALWIFDLHFEYDGDILFWVITAYIFPVGAIKEVSGMEFGVALIVYLAILASASLWLLREKRTADHTR